MKKINLWLVAAFIICGIATSCKNESAKTEASASASVSEEVTDTYLAAIERYMTDSIGAQYSQGDVCIPFYRVVEADETDKNDIKVWGDFWLDNYKLAGDTLKSVSGGSHPGMFHVKVGDNGKFEVTGFDAVGDGSDFTPSAKRIFGDKYEAFQRINSDDKGRQQVRVTAVANYVKAHDLKATVLQDHGWPAVALPQE
jgi:hypothetical protein